MGSLLGGKAGKEACDVIVDNCSIEAASPERCARAITVYLHYDGGLSFADAVSIVLMEELGTQTIASSTATSRRSAASSGSRSRVPASARRSVRVCGGGRLSPPPPSIRASGFQRASPTVSPRRGLTSLTRHT